MSTVLVCPVCFTHNAVDASFCANCDAYLRGEHRADLVEDAEASVEGEDHVGDVGAGDVAAAPSLPGAVDPRAAAARATAARARPRARNDDHDGTSQDEGDIALDGDAEGGAVMRGVEAPAVVADRAARPDLSGQRCWSCGRLAASGQTRCRCGVSLADDDRHATPSLEQRRARDEPLLGRLAFARAQRRANDGRRAAFDRPLAAKVIWVRGLVAALAAVVLFAWLGPWSTPIANRVRDVVATVLPGAVRQIDVVSATVPEGAEVVAGFPPGDAFDGAASTAWVAAWEPGAVDPTLDCGAGIAAAPLLVAFDGPSDISELVVRAGLDRSDSTWGQLYRPELIDLEFRDADNRTVGECVRLELLDSDQPNTIPLSSPREGATGAVLRVVQAYEPQAGDTEQVAFAEIGFLGP